MTDEQAKAVHEAVAAIYFDDNSDYRSALWSVVRILDPEMRDLLADDEEKAFRRSCERIGLEM